MTTLEQHALDSFYALDNVVTIKILMPQAEWDALRNEERKGGRCNFECCRCALAHRRGAAKAGRGT
ncbi:hypothetical protein TUM20983_55110 [Mycobacterium antarcticum]|nr:hypothetical protein TUM20983_55110 [Mycolicibacterium sp. TUM20983]GLP81454.1 hypothetical protein TUM20984_28740 [Mycolicibacterium sp. TUM20984]